jgi:hypothetical protein
LLRHGQPIIIDEEVILETRIQWPADRIFTVTPQIWAMGGQFDVCHM